MRKKLLSALLALVMVVGLVPATALATETSADEVKVVTKVEGRSYHLGLSGFDAPDYGRPNDYKSRPEIEITKITFADDTTMENPSKDVIHTLDGSDAKNWWRLADDNVTLEDYSMTAYPKFIEGTYRYGVKLRVDSDENAKYQFADHVDIEITDEYHGEMFWEAEAEGTFSSQRYITSPNYTVDEYGYLIDNTKIEGKQLSIGESKVGVAIKEIDLNSSVMGGTKPYKFEKMEGSPKWITVSEDGIVSGTPEATAAATELKVKVADSGTPAKAVTLTIPVGRTFPATDGRIELAYVQVKLKDVLPAVGASTDMFPRFTLVKAVTTTNQEITADQIPDNAIVFDHAMGNMGCWQKWNKDTKRYEGYYKTTFEEGTYRFGMLLRIQNTGTIAFGEQYKLADDFNVQMLKNDESLPIEKQWEKKNAWSFDTYSTVELTSPDYKVNNDWRDLEGNVEITCTVRTGEPISTHVSGCNAPAGNLRYQWQKQSAKDGTWSNWGKLTESGSMSGNMVQADDPSTYGTGAVRVIVSAVGYEGKLISAPRPINPAVHTEEPTMPKLWYLPDKGNVIFVRNSKGSTQLQEYLLSTRPLTQKELDEAKKRTDTATSPLDLWTSYGDVSILSEKNVFKASPNTLYYVYTRLAGGRGYLAGKEYRYSTIYTGDSSDLIDLARLMLDGYTNYGVGNTIYIPINRTVTINVKKEPENENKRNEIRLKAYGSNPDTDTAEMVPFSIVTETGDKTEIEVGVGNPIPGSIRLKAGDTVGTGYLGAFYPSASGNYGSFYGKWNVVVYDPNNITSFDVVNPPVYSDVKLGVGDTYTPANAKPNIATRPEGALDGYELKWYACVGTGTAGNPVFITSDESHKNEFISVDENTGVVTALKAHSEGDDIYKQVALYAIKGSTQKYLTSYSVTVEAAAEKEGALLVNPGSLSIEKGETASLTAQAVGLPAGASVGAFNWTITGFNAAITQVGGNGNEVEVKANGHGNSTVKVTYTYTVGGVEKTLSATVPVSVHQWDEWQKLDENTHRRECEKCSAVETENHYPTAEGGSSIQPGTGGKTVWKCNACGYTWDNSAYHTVKLDANGGTVTPDYALVSDVGGVGFLPTPERSGYSFSGWYTEKTGGTKVTGDTKLDKSVSTLYARWSTKHHYDGSGGTTTNKPVKSPGTGDAGIVLYTAMGLLSLTGGAWVVGKKRKDK